MGTGIHGPVVKVLTALTEDLGLVYSTHMAAHNNL